jgi:predicted nucleic acid-binding protein
LTEFFVLDSGALGALADNDPRMLRLVETVIERHSMFEIPAVVIAECFRDDPRDANYNRVVKALGGFERAVVAVDWKIAKAAGRLLRESQLSETIDAIVVATAERHAESTVVSGDERHVERLVVCTKNDVGFIALNQLPST